MSGQKDGNDNLCPLLVNRICVDKASAPDSLKLLPWLSADKLRSLKTSFH